MDLDRLESERGGPWVVLERGRVVVVPAATTLPYKTVSAGLMSPHAFATLIWPADAELTAWKVEAAQRGWVAHNGLPEPAQMKRLVYMLEKYGEGVEVDLRAHYRLSLGDLWRARRWRELLGLIDHLPTNSHMNRLLSNDEEYMEQVLKNDKSTGPSRPSMAEWSLTNNLLATLIDAVNKNTVTQIGIANPKGQRPKVEPQPRPATVAEKVRLRLTKQEHESMVGMLLRDRK